MAGAYYIDFTYNNVFFNGKFMKLISFLFSFKTTKFPRRAFLLEDNTVSVIENEDIASCKVKNIISDTSVKSATWWWPAGRAFAEMRGVPEFAVLNMLKDYGFTIANNCHLEHQQVEESESLMDGYIELKLEVSNEKYTQLCQEYGSIKKIKIYQ